MSASTCLTCSKAAGADTSVVICDHGSAQRALSKHFWFSEDQTETGILCQCCWSKIDDFHQFYCEIERVHELPSPLGDMKQELVFPEKTSGSRSTSEDEDEATYHEDDDVDEDDELKDDTVAPATREESPDQEAVSNDNGGPVVESNASEAKVVYRKTSQRLRKRVNPVRDLEEELSDEDVVTKKTPKRRKKTGKTEGGTTEGWQKSAKDDEIITKHVSLGCDTCSENYETFHELQKHSMKEHGKRAYVFCCDLRFNRRPRLVDHIQFHLNPSQFKCEFCSKQFQHSEAIKMHKDKMHTAEEEKTFQCSVCPKKFSGKRYLNIHEKYHRKLGEKDWHCTICDRYFAYQTMLRTHNRIQHSTDYKHVCHICARGFHYLGSYRDHLLTHEPKKDRIPEERVQCAECGVWVTNKKGLGKHMLQHTGNKTCDICGQVCKNEMTLRYHKTQHKKEAISCTFCGKEFKRQILLKEHMATHTGVALYQCDFCDKTFNSNANRASHRKKGHPKEWLEDKLRKNPNLQQELGQQSQQLLDQNW